MANACVNACVNARVRERHYLINVPLNLAQLAVSLSLTSLLTAETRNVHLLWFCRAYGNRQNISGILEQVHTFSRIPKSSIRRKWIVWQTPNKFFFTSINEDNKPDLISTCVSNLLSPASFAPKLAEDSFLIVFRSWGICWAELNRLPSAAPRLPSYRPTEILCKNPRAAMQYFPLDLWSCIKDFRHTMKAYLFSVFKCHWNGSC